MACVEQAMQMAQGDVFKRHMLDIMQQERQQEQQNRLTQTELWTLKLSQVASYVSTTLNIRRLADMIQGATPLSGSPVWLLGKCHEMQSADGSTPATPEVLESMRQDFSSRIWCTYRRSFPALGEGGFTSDVGWGCTLRSGQMLVAEALSRHLLGRSWRRSLDAALPPDMLSVLALFQDYAAEGAPLSIHSICAGGKDHGVLPGRWLGPWTLCKSLEATLSSSRPAGLQVHVVCDPGGGAPTLDVRHIRHQIFGQQMIDPSQQHSPAQQVQGHPAGSMQQAKRQGGPKQLHQDAAHGGDYEGCSKDAEEQEAGGAAASAEQGPEAPAGTPSGSDVLEPGTSSSSHESVREKDESTPPEHQAQSSGQDAEEDQPHEPGPLLLLIPLTLGMGKMNPLYFPQLKQALTFSESVGIVGGRPGSSLFFIGHHEDNLLYLDPHETQAAAPLPAAASSYFCGTVRLMPMTSMDPSLAIGFLCPTLDDFDGLCERLQQLTSKYSSAPLLTVALSSAASGCLDHYQNLEDEIYSRVEALGTSSDDDEAGPALGAVEVPQEGADGITQAEAQPDLKPPVSSGRELGDAQQRQSGKRDEWEVL